MRAGTADLDLLAKISANLVESNPGSQFRFR
jgi:hypothetical protein